VLAGLTAALLAVLLGNLAELGVMVGAWQRAGDSTINTGIPLVDAAAQTVDGALAVSIGGQEAPIYPGDWFWTATRAINAEEGEVAPITEFPFFTFLYGDLHAHMIALPLTMLALAWAVSLVLGSETAGLPGLSRESNGGADERRPAQGLLSTGLFWFTGALAIGVLRPTNTWDWPTYLFLGIVAVGYHAYAQRGLSVAMLGQALLQALALVGLSTLLFWPFIANYGTGYQAFRLWEGSYTYLGNYLVIHGLFLFLVLTNLAREFRAWSRSWTQEDLAQLQPAARPALVLMVAYVPLLLALLFRGYWIAPVVLTLTIVAGLLALRPGLPAARRVILVLIASALGLTLLVELVVLEGDIGRMNTVFKFYMQVWMMFSIAGGAALALVWPAVRRWRPTRRRAWQLVLALLVAAAALYPVLATGAKWRVRMSDEAPTTLDGMAFMQTTTYADSAWDGSSQTIELVHEYDALRWLQQHVEGTPVIAEATPPNVGEAYRSLGSRVAVYTGLPTILGWDWHQQQQRAALPDARIRDRMNDVATLYNTDNPEEARAIIEQYGVRYIYVGSQEWLYYRPEGLLKFDEMADAGILEEIFRNEAISIYRVNG
jgi:YYY domain-containing protein